MAEREVIGFASQFRGGGWTPIVHDETLARTEANRLRDRIVPARMAVPVFADVLPADPQPFVLLAEAKARVTFELARSVWSVSSLAGNGVDGTTFTRVVDLVRGVPLSDAELADVQRLPALTQAWAAAGGR